MQADNTRTIVTYSYHVKNRTKPSIKQYITMLTYVINACSRGSFSNLLFSTRQRPQLRCLELGARNVDIEGGVLVRGGLAPLFACTSCLYLVVDWRLVQRVIPKEMRGATTDGRRVNQYSKFGCTTKALFAPAGPGTAESIALANPH